LIIDRNGLNAAFILRPLFFLVGIGGYASKVHDSIKNAIEQAAQIRLEGETMNDSPTIVVCDCEAFYPFRSLVEGGLESRGAFLRKPLTEMFAKHLLEIQQTIDHQEAVILPFLARSHPIP
jgi:hypothetical protein